MNKKKLDYFRNLLLEQRQEAVAALRADEVTALEESDGVIDTGEVSHIVGLPNWQIVDADSWAVLRSLEEIHRHVSAG